MKKRLTVLNQLPLFISEKRIQHTLRVEDVANELSLKFNAKKEVVSLAALLHDIAKNQTPSTISEFGIDVSSNMKQLWDEYPSVWHAFIGPLLIGQVINLNNTDINNAVKYHTTGHDHLSLEAKIIYVSDFIEPNRTHVCRELVAEFAFSNLNKAVAAVALCSIDKLTKKGVCIHPDTQKCWNAYARYLTSLEKKILEGYLNEN
mgnify:CR=1 FL=1